MRAPGPGVDAPSLLHQPCTHSGPEVSCKSCPSAQGVLASNCPRRPTLAPCKTQIHQAAKPSTYQILSGWLGGHETAHIFLLGAWSPRLPQGCHSLCASERSNHRARGGTFRPQPFFFFFFAVSQEFWVLPGPPVVEWVGSGG